MFVFSLFAITFPGCHVSDSIEGPTSRQVLLDDFRLFGREALFFSSSQHSSSFLIWMLSATVGADWCFVVFLLFLITHFLLLFIQHFWWKSLEWWFDFWQVVSFPSLLPLYSWWVPPFGKCGFQSRLQSVLPLPLFALPLHWLWIVLQWVYFVCFCVHIPLRWTFWCLPTFCPLLVSSPIRTPPRQILQMLWSGRVPCLGVGSCWKWCWLSWVFFLPFGLYWSRFEDSRWCPIPCLFLL